MAGARAECEISILNKLIMRRQGGREREGKLDWTDWVSVAKEEEREGKEGIFLKRHQMQFFLPLFLFSGWDALSIYMRNKIILSGIFPRRRNRGFSLSLFLISFLLRQEKSCEKRNSCSRQY